MELNKLKENELLNFLNHEFYFIVEGEHYNIENRRYRPDNYNVIDFVKLLRIEERKFLIAESVMDSFELYEYFNTIFSFGSSEDFSNSIRTLNEKELDKIISVLKFTKNFNGYLRYMISDWKVDCFDTEEDYLNYTY